MIIRRLAIALLFAFILFVPIAAQAACTVHEYGILYLDSDCDGVIDNTDMSDSDNDGIPDGEPVDNCTLARNGDCDKDQYNCDVNMDNNITDLELRAGFQIDWNKDGIGDACDDADMDTVVDYLDTCRSVYNPTQDPAFCTDTDGDRFEDTIDNCPNDYNTDQLDSDGDGIGDWCDNCRNLYNPAQGQYDCPYGDSGSGGSSVQYNTTPPTPAEGANTDFGPGRLKGNGYGNGCQFLTLSNSFQIMPLMAIAAMLAITAIRRKLSS
ncbi:MAG: thrombospondin type 3 repeat-containing protein [Pseudomonadota bacterium]